MNTFTDVKEGDWYYDAVYWAGKNGVVTGTEFKPGDTATRGQALTFLWRAAGEPATVLKVSPYTDVTEPDWYYTPVLWGFENGLISTAADGQFHADGTLTRAQAITFLCRALEGAPTESKRSFVDVREDDWYFDAANWALETGVVGLDVTHAFDPDDDVTRAQLITFLYRAFDPGAKKASTTAPPPEGFRELGISAESAGVERTYAMTTSGDNGPGTVRITPIDYEIFDEDEAAGYPAREGWEYRDVSFSITLPGNDHYVWWRCVEDYYNTNASISGARWGDDRTTLTFPILWNGEIVDCTLWYDSYEPDGYTLYRYITAQVPKGYDGIVVGFQNGAMSDFGEHGFLNEYYTGPEDFALFRLDGQAD